MRHYKIVSSKIIHENPWAKYIHETFLSDNGQEGVYYFLETLGSGCSMVVPILADGRLLLTVQHRYLRDRPSVEFPCGGLKAGEAAAGAAQRELWEETGFQASDLIKVGSFDGLNGLVKDTTHVFVGTQVEKVSEPTPDNTENIEVIYRRIDEFEEMIKGGEIWDGQTLATWAIVRDYLDKILSKI